MKKLFGSVAFRMVYLALCVVLQAAALVVMFLMFRQYFAYFYGVCILVTIGAVLYLVNEDSNPAYKIAWLIPIMLFPIFGGLFYLMFGRVRPTRRERQRMESINRRYDDALSPTKGAMDALRGESEDAALQASYIERAARAPVYAGTETEYLPLGEAMFARMMDELEKAERFIFMEYFIVQEGKMWNAICEVLARKAKQGVDVRMMYDDFGCMFTLPAHYYRTLEQMGIKCCVFNRFTNIFSSRFNNRDHRKICVIDGNVGFTGGINLADEYINAVQKHGHWKDTAVLLRGEAVWSLTVMFLSLWDFVRHESEPYALYAPTAAVQGQGYVQPFTDSPQDEEIVGETCYMNLINRARRSVWITTPYLIIDNEMITALCTAAKSGVDVRIITPGVPDKKIVYQLTRSYYGPLLKAGVKIYEYTPGFIHAKSFVVDDDFGVVGTINLDFRSLYLHYECAAWMYRTKAVTQLKADFEQTLPVCTPVSPDKNISLPGLRGLGLSVLRIFAPLM